jgi:hypothetical protein
MTSASAVELPGDAHYAPSLDLGTASVDVLPRQLPARIRSLSPLTIGGFSGFGLVWFGLAAASLDEPGLPHNSKAQDS